MLYICGPAGRDASVVTNGISGSANFVHLSPYFWPKAPSRSPGTHSQQNTHENSSMVLLKGLQLFWFSPLFIRSGELQLWLR